MLQSKFLYFLIVMVLIVFSRGKIKVRKINDFIVENTYETVDFSNKKYILESCKFVENTLKYRGCEVLRPSSFFYKNDNIVDSQTSLNEQISTSESDIQATSNLQEERAYGNRSGKGYTIEEFNQLTSKELTEFHGIGVVTAEAIIELRTQRGGFSSFRELLDIKGIGEKKLKRIMGGVNEADGTDQ